MGALPGSTNLLPAAVFLALLAAAALCIALVPRLRHRWSWGRGADAYPVSRAGCVAASAALLLMALGMAAATLGLLAPWLAFMVVLLGFAAFVTAGLADRRRP